MAGKKGRSGRISNVEQWRRRRAAAVAGGEATKRKWEEDYGTPLPQETSAALTAEAKELGIDAPTTVEGLLKFRKIKVVDEQHKKLMIDREYMEGTRIAIELVDDYTNRLTLILIRALDTVHRVMEEEITMTPEQQIKVRTRLRAWSEGLRDSISQEEIYERENVTEQPREPQLDMAEAPGQVSVEED